MFFSKYSTNIFYNFLPLFRINVAWWVATDTQKPVVSCDEQAKMNNVPFPGTDTTQTWSTAILHLLNQQQKCRLQYIYRLNGFSLHVWCQMWTTLVVDICCVSQGWVLSLVKESDGNGYKGKLNVTVIWVRNKVVGRWKSMSNFGGSAQQIMTFVY